MPIRTGTEYVVSSSSVRNLGEDSFARSDGDADAECRVPMPTQRLASFALRWLFSHLVFFLLAIATTSTTYHLRLLS
jgi:hypothetical protein